MAQEVKPIDNTLFGNNRSWRDEARYRLIQSLGPKYGEILGEGFLGESEEDKYLEYLQRTYGSTLPRNPLTDEIGGIPLKSIPTHRPMGEAFTDMSDIGALDQILMVLSGGSSLFPKAAATAAGIETTALLGDAVGEWRKDNPLGAGIMTAAAALPYGIGRAFRGYRRATPETPAKTQQAPSEKLTLYHGSGKDFDKFDLDKAGEGDLGFGVYLTPDKDVSSIYTNLSPSKTRSMYSTKYVDDVLERRGGDPNPTVYKTEVTLSPDEVYQASKYTDQTPVIQSKIDRIIKDFGLPPIDKTKTRGWKDLMDNLEEVGKVPEDVFSEYGIKAMKRDLTYSKLGAKNTGKIYYSVFDDSLLNIVAKNDVPVSVKTPLLSDPNRRKFLKDTGTGIATLGVITSPLASLLRRTGKTMAKLNPTKFLNKQKQVYDAIAGDKELIDTTNFDHMPEEFFPDKNFSPKIIKAGKENYKVEIKDEIAGDPMSTSRSEQVYYTDYGDTYKAQNKIQLDFFEENGFTKNDLLNIEEDGASYMLRDKGVESHFEINSGNADPGTYKRYDIYLEPEVKIINEDLQKVFDDFHDPIKNPRSSPTMTIAERNKKMAKITGKSIDEFEHGIPDDVASQIDFGPEAYSTGDYVVTFKIDGVPVVQYGNSSPYGSYTLTTIPKKEALLKKAQ